MIKIHISEKLTHIAGNAFGREIYETQVLPFIVEGEKTIVV